MFVWTSDGKTYKLYGHRFFDMVFLHRAFFDDVCFFFIEIHLVYLDHWYRFRNLVHLFDKKQQCTKCCFQFQLFKWQMWWFWCVHQKRVMIMRLKLMKLALNNDCHESLWAMLLVKLSNYQIVYFIIFFIFPLLLCHISILARVKRVHAKNTMKYGKNHVIATFIGTFFICFNSKINNIPYLLKSVLILNIGIAFITLNFT